MASSKGLKISSKPSPETSAVLKALKEIKVAKSKMEKLNGFESVGQILTKHGVTEEIGDVMHNMASKYDGWAESLSDKIKSQSELLAKEIITMGLPAYVPENHEESLKSFKQTQKMEKVAASVSKLQGYESAVNVCSKLSGIDFDISGVSSAIADGKTYMYLFTVMTVTQSPYWKSMTPELAQKAGSLLGFMGVHVFFIVD